MIKEKRRKGREENDIEEAVIEEFIKFINSTPINLAGYTLQNVTGHVFTLQWVVDDTGEAGRLVRDLPSFVDGDDDLEEDDYEEEDDEEEEVQGVGRKGRRKNKK